LFNALGREPNTAALDLSAAGIRARDNGQILINRWQQTSAPHVYAAGDCAGPVEIVHTAIQQGELAARHAAGIEKLKPVDWSLLLNVVFTDPQLATIGRLERTLDERGVKYLVASYPFNDHGKSILMEANYGYVKVVAEPERGRILGAEIVGKDAGELIHAFSGPCDAGHGFRSAARPVVPPHPRRRLFTYPLEELAAKIHP
jgi:pyruvate/2-oxoglutarate dehydrogenase complex dihydrolipoamide dehydrogenase (E3) component